MCQPLDHTSTLTAYTLLKDEISRSFSSPPCSPDDLLSYRESQLKSLINISDSLSHHLSALDSSQDSILLKQQYLKLENLFSICEENLKKARSEIKYLKSEIQNLEKNQGNNNLFTVEVYQSEIEDLKKDHSEKMIELQNQILMLQSSNLQKNFVELRNKYVKVKEQLISLRKKIKEFEEVMAMNNEQKKISEMKYLELVNTHKKMFEYIEKLELKVRKFQASKQKKGFSTSSKEDSRSLVSI